MSKSYARFVLVSFACAFVAVVFLRYWPRSEQPGAKSTAKSHRAAPVIRVAHPSGEFIFPGTAGTRDFQLLVVPRSAAVPAGSVLVAFAGFHTEDHCVVLRSTREQARLIFKHDGREDVLAVGPPVGWDGRAFHIRRLGARIEVLADGRRILTGTLPSPLDPATGNEKPYDLGLFGYARGASYVPIQKARLQTLAPIRFLDDFQRDQAVGVWQALQGEWEITAITFAERSANPFALRARFHGLATDDDPLLRGRTERRQVGIGINLGVLEGVPKIERITGDGPAARAGLQEGDILVKVNGVPVLEGGQGRVRQLLHRSGIVRLTILRPGEEHLRHVRVRRGRFRWGDIQEHIPLPGSQPARAALAVAGKDFWTEYRAEVTARARGAGAVGLAFYVRDALHYHLFRMTGALPADGHAPDALRPDRLELVRVSGGREHILAARDFELSPETAYRLAVDVAGESITARIDGHTMLTARDAAAVGGKIGLYATHGDGALFDDVRVVSVPRQAAGNPVPDPVPVAPPARVRPLFLREDPMVRWANPGLEWRRSVAKPSKPKRAGDSQPPRDPELYWQIYPFPGNVTLRLDGARYETLTALLGAGDDDASSGVRFQVERSKHPEGRVLVSILARGNALVEPVSVASEDAARLVFQLDETHARVRAGKRELLSAPLPAGARAGDAVAIAGVLNLDQPAVVRVQADRVLDFRFDRAPDDWHVASGRWGVMNKWICDPRWSWFGGRSDDAVAAIWSKAVFAGDVTLDIWAALMMTSNDPPYEHPGDFCAVILGDGQRLDSGYSLIVGGGGNFWTKLLRSGQDAGVSFNPAARFPSNKIRLQPKPTLHQRWFHIRLARRGSVVTYALDGREYLRFEDADPLPRGQVGLWTLRNGMLIARARVAYEQLVRRDVPTGGAAPFADETFTNQLGDRPDTRVHKTLDPDADAEGAATYEIRSAQAGGNLAFGLRRPLGDLQREGRIRFDYRIDPGTRVDLKLQTSWGPVRVLLTGPQEDDEQIPIIGTVTDAADDGRWRTAELDLYALLQDFFAPRSDAPYFRGGVRLTFGAFTSVGYHTAGLGGNAPGASYAIRSFQVLSPAQDAAGRPRLVRTEFPFERPENHNRVIFHLHAPGGMAPESLYVLVSASMPINGRRFDLRHRALRFEHARGRLELDLERAGLQPADGETIAFVLGGMQDRQGRGAPETTVRWTFRRSADTVGPRRVRVWPKPVRLRPVIDLTFDEGPGGALALGGRDTAVIYEQSGRSGRPGGFVRVVNRRDGGRFGVLFRARTGEFDLTRFRQLSFDYAIGPEVPLDLLVDVAGRPRRTHFADGRDDSTIWSRNEQRLGAIPNVVTDERWHHADVDLFALLARANPKQKRFVGSQLRLEDTGWKGNTAGQRIALDNIRLDAVMAGRDLTGFWIRAADLSGIAAVRTAFDRRPDTTPTGRVDLHPISIWAEHTPPKLRVPGTTDRDLMGLMMVSQRPDLLPGGPHALTVDESGRVYASNRLVAAQQSGTPQRIDPSALPDGPAYFHVQVQDAAGNWSDVVHHRVLLDNTPPRVRRTRPADGAKAATDRIEIVFDDLSGVDPGTIVLLVNGLRYQIGDGRLSYRHDTRTLSLNLTGGPQAIASGATYTVTLESVGDYVGNRLPAPYTFTFTLDLNQDATPPAPPRVRLTTFNPTSWQARNGVETEFGATNDFEQDLGQWQPVRGCTVERTADDAAYGRFAARVNILPDAERFVVSIRDKYWNLKRQPFITFDYKLPPGTKLELWLEVLGNRRRVRLTRQAPNIGAMMAADAPLIAGADGDRGVPSEVLPAGGLVADGAWRRCVIDLMSLVDRADLRLPLQLPLANKLRLIGTAPSDTALVFDNFEIVPYGWAGARVQWTTPDDESGIRGFSYVWDRTPDTVPPATIRAKAAEREAQVPVRQGTCFFHIRCVDGAGNWSDARHVRFDFP